MSELVKLRKSNINKVLDLKDRLGQPIDIFNMEFSLCITNTDDDSGWCKIRGDNIAFTLDDFDQCVTEEDVERVFDELLIERVKDNL